ncbi:toprim domain-containing protein [Bradyrhizobium sp. Arg68]|uniref:DUF7146 domain-containing protein n=1 Tax=Bradyrhizobium ivorense TaxID=2511166 RepID=UPI001E2A8EC4|nr:toprim domain-containing protein [Bradyrhizobium ivorense]MCC8942003.1 toprim domain-containing protein [Bradyrhizobium ivorense]
MSDFALHQLTELTGGCLGRHDVPCPVCGPDRRSPINQRRRVLRIWHDEPNFANYLCARCGIDGWAADHSAQRTNPALIERIRAKAEAQRLSDIAGSLEKSRWLWSQRQPIGGTIAESYLRRCRGYTGELPGTLGFLPARGEHPPAMIAAFGTAAETTPGALTIYDAAVHGVHITKLQPDGSGKAGTEADKLTIGRGNTSPIMLAPPNDGLGLVIAEGIEDALSVHAATGLGAWAAGTAGRMPALANAVPNYVESVVIMVDADDAGERNAIQLASGLDDRGIEVLLVRPGGAA